MQSEPDLPLFRWRPAPQILPFPGARSRPLLHSIVKQAGRYSEATAERMITNAADKRRAHMVWLGVNPTLASAEAERFKAAALAMVQSAFFARGA